ncbi:MAG: hypothetical protein AMK75_06665, partial [Planctomycetes bacterium SM23_65]
MNKPTREITRLRYRRIWKKVRLFTRYLVLTAVGFTMILPFIWMLSTSLKTKEGAVEIPPKWIPRRDVTYAEIDGKTTQVRTLKTMAT